MGYTPVRRYLAPSYGKNGELNRWAIQAIRDHLVEYRDGDTLGESIIRAIDNIVALAAREETVLPAERLGWESREVESWLPKG